VALSQNFFGPLKCAHIWLGGRPFWLVGFGWGELPTGKGMSNKKTQGGSIGTLTISFPPQLQAKGRLKTERWEGGGLMLHSPMKPKLKKILCMRINMEEAVVHNTAYNDNRHLRVLIEVNQ
jgi:hypothetical protein